MYIIYYQMVSQLGLWTGARTHHERLKHKSGANHCNSVLEAKETISWEVLSITIACAN